MSPEYPGSAFDTRAGAIEFSENVLHDLLRLPKDYCSPAAHAVRVSPSALEHRPDVITLKSGKSSSASGHARAVAATRAAPKFRRYGLEYRLG